MSASQDKKKRNQQRAEGTERRQVASAKAAQEKKKSRVKWIVGSIVVVLLVAFIIVGNSNLFYTAQKAVKIGDQRYSVAEMNYEYMSVYNQYNQYAQYFGDVSPKAEYTMDETYKTWDDFYKAQAIQSLARKEALVALAEQNGVKLTDEEIKQVDDLLASYADAAKQYGYANVDKFITANFGNGVTKKLARELMLRDALADKYVQYYQDNLTFTDDQLAAEYAANKDEYDNYSFQYYVVEAETTQSTDADGNVTTTASAESMAAAKEVAEQIKAATAGDAGSFADAVGQYGKPVEQEVTDEQGVAVTDEQGNPVTETTTAEPVASEKTQGSSITEYGMPFGDWVKDAARVQGEVEIFEQENVGYYVVLFEGRDDNSGLTVNVRHILIQAEDTDGDGTYSEEELAAAKAKIEEIKAEYDAGEQTEDAFAALANQYSTDPGSNTNGGLYENVVEGQMVEEFNNWCFDAARQPGDVGIVEDAAYNGYHLMYFVGSGESNQNVIARNALTSEALSAFESSLTADLKYDDLFAMRYVGVK